MGICVSVNQNHPASAVIAQAVEVARAGGVLIVPTDSVYGIGAAAFSNNPGHERIFTIKHRDRTQTLPWLVGKKSDFDRYAKDAPAWAYRLVQAYWPGALTLVVKAADIVPDEYVLPQNHTIALRMPASKLVCEIINGLGVPLATTSANIHGKPSAVSEKDVEQELIDCSDLILDGGPAPLAVASTIVDCTSKTPRILREGAIPTEVLLATAGFEARE